MYLKRNPFSISPAARNLMAALLTLKEMAERLSISTKTLTNRVNQFGYPHYLVGRMMRFDEHEVKEFIFTADPKPEKSPRFQPTIRKAEMTRKSKYAERLGL